MKTIIWYFFPSIEVEIFWVGRYFEIEGFELFGVRAVGNEGNVGSENASLSNERGTPIFSSLEVLSSWFS